MVLFISIILKTAFGEEEEEEEEEEKKEKEEEEEEGFFCTFLKFVWLYTSIHLDSLRTVNGTCYSKHYVSFKELPKPTSY